MGEPNQQLQFEHLANRVVYEAPYKDDRGQWRILVSGEAERVEEFVERRDLILRIELLDEETESTRSNRPPRPKREQVDLDEPAQDDDPFRLPGREVTIELLETTLPRGPYRMHFELDPPIPANDSDPYCFRVPERDTNANVGFSSDIPITVLLQNGGVTVSSSYGTSGSVYSGAYPGSWWTVVVINNNIAPATYSLTGDINVP
jgi:hypothetical protein